MEHERDAFRRVCGEHLRASPDPRGNGFDTVVPRIAHPFVTLALLISIRLAANRRPTSCGYRYAYVSHVA
jgi:hypothetical protein